HIVATRPEARRPPLIRMAEISVTFEDGATERFPAGTSAGEALRAYAARNHTLRRVVKRAIAARVEGRDPAVVDLSRPLLADCRWASLAGAYWRRAARDEQLQRSYGTAWARKEDLEAYLARLEEAKQRDHRRLGQALDLFPLHPIAPGSPFFHPKGAVVYNTLVEYIRGLYARYGYTEVITPLVYKTELWKTSGHYDAFRDDMFLMTIEDDEYGVKPMNCPGHCYLFATRKHSYRDLPVR